MKQNKLATRSNCVSPEQEPVPVAIIVVRVIAIVALNRICLYCELFVCVCVVFERNAMPISYSLKELLLLLGKSKIKVGKEDEDHIISLHYFCKR